MTDKTIFLANIDREIECAVSELDSIKGTVSDCMSEDELIRRLKIALKNELEASELAALWISTTPELDIKLSLARQAGDEARHYSLIADHLRNFVVDLDEFNPLGDGYSPMFNLLSGLTTTVERTAAALLTRESLALKKNEHFIEFCDAFGAVSTAALYRERIQPDEEWHVHSGRKFLSRYAVTPEDHEAALKASKAVLQLAVTIQKKQVYEMNLSHAPGC